MTAKTRLKYHERSDVVGKPAFNATDTSYHSVFQGHVDPVYRLIGRLKHPKFSEEKEWRLISKYYKRTDDDTIRYRAGNSMLIPYVEFRLCEEDDRLDLNAVVVGPTPNHNLSMNAVDKFMSSQRVLRSRVFASGIPFRGW